MADITEPTQDVTIMDNTTGKQAEVITRTDGKDALVVDAIISAIGGTTDVRNLQQKTADEGNLFITTSDFISEASSTGEVGFILIKNPASSGRTIKIGNVSWHTVGASNWKFRIYANPTITANGTALTVRQMNIGNGTPVAEYYKFPTLSANGANIFGSNGQDDKHQEPLLTDLGFSLILNEGDSVLLTLQNVKNIVTNFNIIHAEIDI